MKNYKTWKQSAYNSIMPDTKHEANRQDNIHSLRTQMWDDHGKIMQHNNNVLMPKCNYVRIIS